MPPAAVFLWRTGEGQYAAFGPRIPRWEQSLRTNTGQIQRRRARARPWTPRPQFNISASLGDGSHPVMLREEGYLLKPHSRTARLLKVVRAPLHHPPDHAGGEAREKGRSGSGCG